MYCKCLNNCTVHLKNNSDFENELIKKCNPEHTRPLLPTSIVISDSGSHGNQASPTHSTAIADAAIYDLHDTFISIINKHLTHSTPKLD